MKIAIILLSWLSLAAEGVATPARGEACARQQSAAQNDRQSEMPYQRVQIGISMATLNNLIALSYLRNIATYARMLRDQVMQCNSVDGEFARDVAAEIWLNFDRLDCYRREQMNLTQGGMRAMGMMSHSSILSGAAMAANAPSEYLALREIGAERGPLTPPSPAVEGDKMTDMMRRMEACLPLLGAHLIELERETGAACPNPKWALEHTNAILRLIDEMSTTRGGSRTAR
ncbi:MAG TPA: hypothetical protein VFY40_21195 [Blastocatellia bacterium]|nr:hypothetical protein [Blastocatellia bacterium]